MRRYSGRMTMIVYGISNCDTVKKARRWLGDHGVAYRFHDFRKDGLEPDQLQRWCDALGWEALLNRSGTTWRKLPDAQKQGIDPQTAQALMIEHPVMIRRPLVEWNDGISTGFKPDDWQARLGL